MKKIGVMLICILLVIGILGEIGVVSALMRVCPGAPSCPDKYDPPPKVTVNRPSPNKYGPIDPWYRENWPKRPPKISERGYILPTARFPTKLFERKIQGFNAGFIEVAGFPGKVDGNNFIIGGQIVFQDNQGNIENPNNLARKMGQRVGLFALNNNLHKPFLEFAKAMLRGTIRSNGGDLNEFNRALANNNDNNNLLPQPGDNNGWHAANVEPEDLTQPPPSSETPTPETPQTGQEAYQGQGLPTYKIGFWDFLKKLFSF